LEDEEMDHFRCFPDRAIAANGPVSEEFVRLKIKTLHAACRSVHEMPYGYNSDRDEFMILFKEGKGTCTTKHAVIGTLARELEIPIHKHVGIYGMTEEIVTGTRDLLKRFDLPYIPMLHCFLVYETFRVDLTEGNRNGKNRPIEEFLFTERVDPNISGKDEYMLYRKALSDLIHKRPELNGVDMRRVLQAREEGLKLLKANIV
jgi:hypothetical protein